MVSKLLHTHTHTLLFFQNKKIRISMSKIIYFFITQQSLVGQGFLIIEALLSHSDTTHLVGLLGTGD
jgi:hypothetical protein